MKLPKLSKFQPVKKRPDGSTTYLGCTGREWTTNCAGFAVLYAIMIAFFTVLLVISQQVRNSKDTFLRPGSDTFIDDDDP